MSSPPVWNLWAVIWFHFTISSLVLLPSLVTLSVWSFFLPASPFSQTFSRNSAIFLLRDRLFHMAPVEQPGEVSWSVVCAACCHTALVFAVMHFFFLLLFLFYTEKNLVLINRRNGPRYQRVLALCAFLTGAIPKGQILQKNCV